jgi:2-polyprenyl-3-methyl-5-hydroxy-6-metoxy-1,4-benzoquinol methylase
MYLTIEQVLERNKARGYGYDENNNVRPLTSEEFYTISCEMGLNQDNPGYRDLFERFSKWVVRTLNVKTGLEIGSGPGYFLYCLNKQGLDTRGMDGNSFSQAYFKSKHPEFADRYHLDPFFEQSYGQVDVLLTIEVFEHINDEGLESVFKKIREQVKPKVIVFSSTPHADPNPGWDVQWGHINMKPTHVWDELFAKNGFAVSKMVPPITDWARLYVNESVLGDLRYSKLLNKQSWLGEKLARL